MRLYITPECSDKGRGWEPYFEKLEKRARKHTCLLPDFKPYGSYYKIRRGKFRIIAKFVHVSQEPVICLVDVIPRKSGDYDSFMLAITNQRAVPSEKRYLQATDDKLLRDWLRAEKKREEEEGRIVVPPLPPELHIWLRPVPLNLGNSRLVIYETVEWVQTFVHDKDIARFWQTYLDLVIQAADETPKLEAELPCKVAELVRSRSASGHFIYYAVLPGPAVLLMGAGKGTPHSDIEATFRNALVTMFGETLTSAPSPDELRPHAARCYPDDILGGPEHWLKIEEHVEGNLALSPEQESCLRMVYSDKGLPIFINGRAGSGKSLMLHYIMADLLHLQEKMPGYEAGAVIYLTCNEQLLERARESVAAIMDTNSKFAEAGVVFHDRIAELVRKQMQPFRKFLIEAVSVEEKEQFPSGMVIDFARFRDAYEKWAGRPKGMGAEICWHIIRVYLKGYFIDLDAEDEDTQFDPDDYAEIGRKDRTVDEEEFRIIYEKVLPWYEEMCRDKGLWDDQDLVRYLLSHDIKLGGFTAILCDEAQDLTRLELQLVLKLSAYTHYDLSDISHVQWLPFVFAGDPFQTLNPTGFLATSLTRAFHDEVVTVLDPTNRWSIRMRPTEMLNNYRSTREIVSLSNLIQLARRCLFDHKELEPQACWFRSPGSQPLRFILGENVDREQMRENLSDTILIVPCEEGAEEEFVTKDDDLREIMSTGKGRPKNVLSAATSKGLEFNKVVLYKFGKPFEDKKKNIQSLLEECRELSDSERLWAEYFFNKLYVGVSRGVGNVFMIDTKDGDALLWKSLCASRKGMLEGLPGESHWAERSAETIPLGSKFNVAREENPEAVAEEFEKKGRVGRNAELLERAADYYVSLNRHEKAKRCRAEAFEIRGAHEAAGDLFLQLGGGDDRAQALQCYWAGLCWQKYLEGAADLDAPHSVLARFMGKADAAALTGLLIAMEREPSPIEATSRQWREGLKKWAVMLRDGAVSLEPELWARAGAILTQQSHIDRKVFLHTEALCWMKAGNAHHAKAAFDRLNDPDLLKGPVYNRIRAEVVGMPAGLEFLERAEAHEQIINAWEAAKEQKDLNPVEWIRFVAPAYEKMKRPWQAFLAWLKTEGAEPSKLIVLFRLAQKATQNTELMDGLITLIESFARHRRFQEAAQVLIQVTRTWDGASISDKERLASAFLLKLATSQDQFASVQREAREPLTQLGKLCLDSKALSISWVVVGAALERIGFEVDSLAYYEKFFDDPVRGRYSRTRWLATKKRQLEMRGGTTSTRELSDRMRQWGFDPAASIPEYPSKDVVLNPTLCEIQPEKLASPSKKRTEEFEFEHLRITVHHDKHLVLLVDPDLYTVRCEVVGRLVTGEKAKIIEETDEAIHFIFESDDASCEVDCVLDLAPTRKLSLKMGASTKTIVL